MPDGKPVSSGVFDYVKWLMDGRLSDMEKETLHCKFPLTVGSMCSGMGTEDIGLRALQRAMVACGHDGFEVISTFKAESDPRKADFLRRHTSKGTMIYNDNAALASPLPVNARDEQTERPPCKILVCGIVCVDISSLTPTPKPVSGRGKSGVALEGLLQSAQAMRFDDRPELICLECVARLGQHRRVDPDNRTGTKYVTDELGKLGYVGDWCLVRPRDFFLPQSRARVYSIHLKRSDFSEASAAARKKDIEKAFQIIKSVQTTVTEKLEVLLARVPFKHQANAKKGRASGQTRTAADSSNRKWPSAHDSYAEKHGLMPSDRQIPPDFVSEVGHLVSPRSLEASWLKLVVACQKAQEVWKNVLVVFPLSHSISFASASRIFPLA
jgi:site-specific DNA-cytosine methylase